MIARAIVTPSKEITSLKKTFCDLPGSTISKPTMNVTEFFISWTFVLLHFNKNCKQPNY